jgi:copper chaperone
MKGNLMKKLMMLFAIMAASTSSLALAADQETKLNITGMFCGDCVSKVKGALEKTPGVKSAEVNLDSNTATVKFDDTKTNPKGLADVVTDTGFETSVANSIED